MGAMEDRKGMDTYIPADHGGEFQRAHWESCLPRRTIDHFRRDTFLCCQENLIHAREENTVDEKARTVLYSYGDFLYGFH
jgi:hypothetical protein